MTARIFNILMGLWLFASAFVLPQGRGQWTSTAICGALAALFAALTSYTAGRDTSPRPSGRSSSCSRSPLSGGQRDLLAQRHHGNLDRSGRVGGPGPCPTATSATSTAA